MKKNVYISVSVEFHYNQDAFYTILYIHQGYYTNHKHFFSIQVGLFPKRHRVWSHTLISDLLSLQIRITLPSLNE